LRIRAELVDAFNGHTLWSDHYDRPYKNLFALQDDITQAVASALQAKLSEMTAGAAVVQSDRPRNANLEAYNAYLEGNFYYDRATAKALRQAIAAYRHAIKLDPKYAAAYARLSRAWMQLAKTGLSAGPSLLQSYVNARAASDTALALTYAGMGEKTGADQALQAFIAKHANDAAYQIADIYAYRKQPDEAFSWLNRAWRQHDSGITLLLYDPFLLHYKDDPRFTAFCKKVGLPVPG